MNSSGYVKDPIPSDLFMPSPRREAPDPNRLELSVFRVDGLSEKEAWKLGWEWTIQVGRRLHGRADFPDRAGGGLTYEVDEPPDLHRVFWGWPAEMQAQMLLAHDLADAATCVPHPGGRTIKKADAASPYPGIRPDQGA
jgi:hypothetical protein